MATHLDGATTRVGEVSGVRAKDINREEWTWEVCHRTTTAPGGLVDKGTKDKRPRTVPIIHEIRPMVARRLDAVGRGPMARLFTGPRGGCITTAALRDATTGMRSWSSSAPSTFGTTISDTRA